MKRIFRLPLAVLPLSLILAVVLGACSDAPQQASRQASRQAGKSLRLGVMPSMDYLPLAVALREGYHHAEGLSLELVTFYSANDRDAALQSGSIDGAVIDLTGAVLQRAGGFDLKLASRCDAPFYVMAGKKSGITAAADLKGAKLAVSRNTVIDYLLDRALAEAGLAPRDVEKVEVNKIPLRYELLQSGQIDVTALPDPLALMAERQGHTVLDSNLRMGFGITGIAFPQRVLDAKGDAVRAMYRAYDKGAAYLRANPPASVGDILTAHMGFPEALVPFARLPEYADAALPREDDMLAVRAWLAGRGLVPADWDTASAIAPGYVE